jgi:hypothetical protein
VKLLFVSRKAREGRKVIFVMDVVEDIHDKLGDSWLPAIYRDKIRSQRTRAHQLDIQPKEQRPEILHTLLGIELKVGKRRFACPDLATARYLRVFARIGCREFAVPYDITRISSAADELETSWHQMLLLLDRTVEGKSTSAAGRLRSSLIKGVREELDEIGPGDLMPAFRQSTKQRTE